MNKIAYYINRSAVYFSEQTAVICDRQLLTFQQVDQYSNALARGMHGIGMAKGDRVGVLLHNCSQYVVTDFALAKGGYVRVPLNTRLIPAEWEFILQDSEANTIVYDQEFEQTVQEIGKSVPTLKNFICVGSSQEGKGTYFYDTIIIENDHSTFAIETDEDDLFQISYTSGTTGKPKGAVTNVRSRISSLINVYVDEVSIGPQDVMLHVASLGHGSGTKVLPYYIKGATNVLMPKFSVEEFLEYVERYRVTATWMVPTIIAMILEYSGLKNHNFSSLKTIIYAGAPMPVATLKNAIDVFGNIFVQVYGLTEAPQPDLVLSKDDHLMGLYEKPNILSSAGRESLNVRVRIVDEEENDVKVGQPGEIIIQGDNIMKEYWKKPDVTAETIREGFLYTGDIGYIDENGYVYIIDRKKDMIISGGYNIYPREVEEVLYEHPAILEATVVGVPGGKWGESVKACVVLRDTHAATEEEIIDFCKKRLSGYKKPTSVDFFDSLPKSSNGKILKRKMRDRYWTENPTNI